MTRIEDGLHGRLNKWEWKKGADTGTVDKFQLRGREKRLRVYVEGLGLGHAARVSPNCQGRLSCWTAGMIALNTDNTDHQPGQ
jgi:hypothetical protein